MLKRLNFSKKKELSNSKLNKTNHDISINRGVEFILRGRKKKNTKTLQIKFPGAAASSNSLGSSVASLNM